MKNILAATLLFILLTGCINTQFEDDLRGVSVTNNPHLMPKSPASQGPSSAR